jgi:hypothetical protein
MLEGSGFSASEVFAELGHHDLRLNTVQTRHYLGKPEVGNLVQGVQVHIHDRIGGRLADMLESGDEELVLFQEVNRQVAIEDNTHQLSIKYAAVQAEATGTHIFYHCSCTVPWM